MSQASHIEIFEGEDGQFYFRLRARNGRILDVSEGYTRYWSAKRGARAVAPNAEIRDKR